jgi:hypothetical protein
MLVKPTPEPVVRNSVQKTMRLLFRIAEMVWNDYYASPPKREHYLELLYYIMDLIEWICVNDYEYFIFTQSEGSKALEWLLKKSSLVLSFFRRSKTDLTMYSYDLGEALYNKMQTKKHEKENKYHICPFSRIGVQIQNILLILLSKNNSFLNQLLVEANFGYIFGDQLLMQYEYMRKSIDAQVDRHTIMDVRKTLISLF